MEENFDIDKHIDRIKSQMGEENKDYNDPDNSIFRQPDLPEEEIRNEVLEGIANDEPSLENYASDVEQQEENQQSEQEVQEPQEPWQDPFMAEENDAVKKYVIYIAKDFVPSFDSMNSDERSAYVNDAIQLKVDLEGKDRKWHLFKRILRHIIVSVFTLILAVPALFWFADKSIKATVQNYGYVQENFEKLYKERADREKTIQRIQTMRLGL